MFGDGVALKDAIGGRLVPGFATATAAYDISPIAEQSVTARHSFFVVARTAIVDLLSRPSCDGPWAAASNRQGVIS
jgi:hypothetical protein